MGGGFFIEIILSIQEACLSRDADLFKSEILDGNANLLADDLEAVDEQ